MRVINLLFISIRSILLCYTYVIQLDARQAIHKHIAILDKPLLKD